MALKFELIKNGTGIAFPTGGIVGNRSVGGYPHKLDIPFSGIILRDYPDGRGGIVFMSIPDETTPTLTKVKPDETRTFYGLGVTYEVTGIGNNRIYFMNNL